MTSANLNIVLTNALCCVSELSAKLSKMYSIGNKCADSELVKLKLLNDYIDTLSCYRIDTITSKYKIRLDYNGFFNDESDPAKNYTFIINGISYTLPGSKKVFIKTLLLQILSTIPDVISYSYYEDPDKLFERFSYLEIETPCNIHEITFQNSVILTGEVLISKDIPMYQTGICEIKNCITEDQFNQMVAYVMNACDICECQLTK